MKSSNPARRTPLSRSIALAVSAVAIACLAGCAPGAGGGSGANATGPIRTDASELGKVTLTVWDTRNSPGQKEAQDQLNKEFEAKYPNIKVKRVLKAFNDYEATLKLALSSSNPPDVAQINQGYGDLATFAKAGLLRPVDDYAKAYGWTDRFNPDLLAQNKATAKGEWGVGDLYGPSNQAELVGIYYNKKLLAQLGLPVPTTLSEWEAQLPRIKAAGQLPINLGTSDKYGAIHIFGMIQAILGGSDYVNNLVFGQGDQKWTDQPSTEAAKLLQDWSQKGYISPGANGQSASDMDTKFGTGVGVYMIDGSWAAPQEQQALGKNVGFTLLSRDSGGTPATEGGLSLLWGIPSHSKKADAAAAYIDFLLSPAAEDTVAKGGDLPALKTGTFEPEAGSVQSDVYDSLHTVVAKGTLLPYLDYTTSDFYDVLATNIQQLIGGSSTPAQMLQTLQQTQDTAKEARR